MSFVTFDYYFLKFVYIFFGFPDKVAVESQENMYVCISQSCSVTTGNGCTMVLAWSLWSICPVAFLINSYSALLFSEG